MVNFYKNAFTKLKKSTKIDSIKEHLIDLKLKTFKPKMLFKHEVDGFTIKTAGNLDELKKVLRLRHDVYTKNYNVSEQFAGIDFDPYDLLGDHIILIDNKEDKIIGTYRLLSSLFSRKFYSTNEFETEEFLRMPGVKLELGRACIHEDYRTGTSLSLVWKGLAHYAKVTQSDYLFGCSSVKINSYRLAYELYKYFCEKHYSSKYNISPKPKYQFTKKEKALNCVRPDYDIKHMAPSLLKSYLKAGAKIHSFPAFDRSFDCIDFFTILDLQEINPIYFKRYFVTPHT